MKNLDIQVYIPDLNIFCIHKFVHLFVFVCLIISLFYAGTIIFETKILAESEPHRFSWTNMAQQAFYQ